MIEYIIDYIQKKGCVIRVHQCVLCFTRPGYEGIIQVSWSISSYDLQDQLLPYLLGIADKYIWQIDVAIEEHKEKDKEKRI